MPSNLVRQGAEAVATARSGVRVDRSTSRALAALEQRTLLDLAHTQSRGLVAQAMTNEIDHLTRDAMAGQAMLHRWGATLSQGDPFIADDMKFFADVAKMGKGEIIANLIDDFCRRGR